MTTISKASTTFVVLGNHDIQGGNNMGNDSTYNSLFISSNLKALRLKHKLSTTDVGNLIGKSRQGYLNYENGSREISISDLVTLSGYYNVSVDEMIGNPFSMSNDLTIGFRTFYKDKNSINEIAPTTVSSIYDDVLCYSDNSRSIKFFWKTSEYHINHVMIFRYFNEVYVSKVFYKHNGGGHFYINDEPKYFTKPQSENIIFLGVYMGNLTREFVVNKFFDMNFRS